MAWQVVEKDSYGTDWQCSRYGNSALTRFDTKEAATSAAVKYITECNCNNPLTKESKGDAIEVFMETDEGIFLGILDEEPWYLTYPKDISGKSGVTCRKGDRVKDKTFFGLEGKTEVAVRPLPGT